MLLALPGTSLPQIQEVWSHPRALAQCRHALEELGVQPIAHRDTAGAAKLLKEENLNRVAVLASRKAAEIYGLDVLASSLQDRSHNATRFIVLEREQPRRDPESAEQFVTTLLFQLRSVPAALYKALGGFATNGVNRHALKATCTEALLQPPNFLLMQRGILKKSGCKEPWRSFFCEEDGVRILGTYPRSEELGGELAANNQPRKPPQSAEEQRSRDSQNAHKGWVHASFCRPELQASDVNHQGSLEESAQAKCHSQEGGEEQGHGGHSHANAAPVLRLVRRRIGNGSGQFRIVQPHLIGHLGANGRRSPSNSRWRVWFATERRPPPQARAPWQLAHPGGVVQVLNPIYQTPGTPSKAGFGGW